MIADVHLAHPSIVLSETIRALPDAHIRTEWQAAIDPVAPFAFFSVRAPDFEAVDEALEADPSVTDAVVVAETDRKRIYRITSTDAWTEPIPTILELGIAILSAESDRDGWLVRLQVPDRETFVGLREHCEREGITIRTEQLYSADQLPEMGGVGLTDAQYEVLVTAYESGYFEEPRALSLSDLAEELGISPTATSGRLRRATKRLVETQLAVDDG
ncbi:helix-turn-helix domain-containing protein [Natronorarus salvus]|uniref:helix-turn-helix domain-containing protein n=1 Tax=Natronorarus salvus TaxID=3117733 RepID=UPI002F2690DD